jgi:hypothetical protein
VVRIIDPVEGEHDKVKTLFGKIGEVASIPLPYVSIRIAALAGIDHRLAVIDPNVPRCPRSQYAGCAAAANPYVQDSLTEIVIAEAFEDRPFLGEQLCCASGILSHH